ncbi:nuclear transport factor 2 family protein [Emcibacter nanhaiensis]|uniref:Nuclear transport factor 2 family protein n=1 Tax=Emcibacter nanhaiensis TaxID=1505037 RepID=A0A501PGA9_9PROT|nr:nuclear transport factor 2 family protein [Emcibacter nanhaiensis]TPD59011.1 nuclear transport factor 2 family protein [Emcibacter nanhaiensis]
MTTEMTGEEKRAIEWYCQQLLNRITNLLDQGRWQELADCYTEDATLARPSDPDNPFRGRAEILASLEARPPRTTCHLLTNSMFEVKSPTEVLAFSRVLLISGDAGNGGAIETANPLLVGSFTDELKKTGEGWQIHNRQGSIDIKYNPQTS